MAPGGEHDGDLDCQCKTAYVLAHKLREAMAIETKEHELASEVGGANFSGYVKPANHRENRRDRRLAVNQSGKRRVVVAMRERNGRTPPFVFCSEEQAIATVGMRVAPDATIYADEAPCRDVLHARFLTKRINHSQSYSE